MDPGIPPPVHVSPPDDFASDILREFEFGADYDFGREFSFGGIALILLLAPLIMMVSPLSSSNLVAVAVVADAAAVAGEIGQSACTA